MTRTTKYLASLLLSGLSVCLSAQTAQISGVINVYTPIETLLLDEVENVDSVIVTSTVGFEVGDTVMVYCPQGSGIRTSDADEDNLGIISPSKNAGKYAFMLIDELAPGNTVVLNAAFNKPDTIDFRDLEEGEVAQLIRVPSYRNAKVTGTVTAPAWNGKTGGVVAMFVSQVLELEANIDVSGKGFRGARELENYNGNCTSTDPVAYDSAFYVRNLLPIRAGLKGEGITDTTFQSLRGWSRNINGGRRRERPLFRRCRRIQFHQRRKRGK